MYGSTGKVGIWCCRKSNTRGMGEITESKSGVGGRDGQEID